METMTSRLLMQSMNKVAMIDFMDGNQTGMNDLQVTVQVLSGVSQSVQVKYVVLSF